MVRRTPLNQRQRELLWTRQAGLCSVCRDPLEPGRFEDDHAIALIDGGTNDLANRRLLHGRCHSEKSAQEHVANSHVKRIRYGRTKKSAPMPGSRKSKIKKHMDGSVSFR